MTAANTSTIISVINKDYGYMVFLVNDHHLPEELRRVAIQFWITGGVARNVTYQTKSILYKEMKQYVGTDLADYTELHKIKAKMGLDFINYYENSHM